MNHDISTTLQEIKQMSKPTVCVPYLSTFHTFSDDFGKYDS